MAPFWVKPATSARIESLPSSPTVDLRSELFHDRPGSVAVVLDMAAFDDAALEEEAERGTQLAEDALRMTLESTEMATATAEAVQNQRRQLEGVRDALTDVNANLDAVDGTVEKLTKSKIRRVAETPFRKLGRGTGRRRKIGAVEGDRKDNMREKEGVGKRERLGERVDQLFGREQVMPMEAVLANAVPEDDYGDISNVKAREQLKQQDRLLDETSLQLRNLKELALGIQKEIELEGEIIDEIDAPHVTHRIRTNHAKIVRALRV